MPALSNTQVPFTTPQARSEVPPQSPKAPQVRDMTVNRAARLLRLSLQYAAMLPKHRASFVEQVMRGATEETILKALRKLSADEVMRLPKTRYTRRVLERIEGPSGSPKSRKAPKQPKALPRARKQQKETS